MALTVSVDQPVTPTDKRRAVALLLADPEWLWSDHEIARRYAREPSHGGEASGSPSEAPGDDESTPRTTTRHGSIATMEQRDEEARTAAARRSRPEPIGARHQPTTAKASLKMTGIYARAQAARVSVPEMIQRDIIHGTSVRRARGTKETSRHERPKASEADRRKNPQGIGSRRCQTWTSRSRRPMRASTRRRRARGPHDTASREC